MIRCPVCGKEKHKGKCVFSKGVSVIEDLKAKTTKNEKDISAAIVDVDTLKKAKK